MLYQNRREHIFGLGSSLGALAMTDLIAKGNPGPLAPKKPMHDAKAKAVIMLFMEGGPSQVDTFDPKPKLDEMHKKEMDAIALPLLPGVGSMIAHSAINMYSIFGWFGFDINRNLGPGSR